MELEGKVAAITGGTRGIGRAIAEAFVAEGASVVLNGRSPHKGQQALDEMGAGDQAIFLAGDVKTRQDCDALVDKAVDHYGKIDIMVCNAGGSTGAAPVAEMTDDAVQDALLWNYWHTFWCMRKSLGYMIPQQSGRIINISSIEGKAGKPAVSHYVANKHAINGLTKSCAVEVGTLGITVNSLCPGAIETDVMKSEGPGAAEAMGMSYQGLLDWFASEAATKRLNEVEDVALVATLLASEAGAGITGSLINVDGGTLPY